MQQLPGCYNDSGLTLKGFLNINETALKEGTYENMIWLLLRRYGYNNEFRLDDDWLLPPIARTPDQSVELTSEAIEFLKGVFIYFDMDGDGNLDENELDLLFDTAPER
ncbi:putative EF-hand domain, EF hand associated, type-2, EF-Hand 1, calcium-binding protein [Helianthus anomalus]